MHKPVLLLSAMLLSAPCFAKECATARLDAEITKADDAAIYFGAMLSRDEPK